jgi:hypothetical protein
MKRIVTGLLLFVVAGCTAAAERTRATEAALAPIDGEGPGDPPPPGGDTDGYCATTVPYCAVSQSGSIYEEEIFEGWLDRLGCTARYGYSDDPRWPSGRQVVRVCPWSAELDRGIAAAERQLTVYAKTVDCNQCLAALPPGQTYVVYYWSGGYPPPNCGSSCFPY